LINIITADNQQGQGSGFIIDNEGHILTNNHVVENTTDVKVVLHDGQTPNAEIVGTDRENDLALLKVDPSKLSAITPLPLGDSDKVKPGQMAIALGSPFELEGSITVGIISGVGRPLTGSSQRTMLNILQTDAAINPGNSGGPLLNSSGEVVGINTAIETLSSGIGFAIPINTAKSLLPELLKGGEVQTAWLGIQTIDIDEELVSELNLSVHSGIYVVNVTADGPAEKAGLKGGGLDQQGKLMPGGDIITAIDGKSIRKVEDVLTYLNSKRPGDNVSLSVQRGEKVLTIQVTLGEWPESFG
jgi:serine protease Do